MDEFLSVAMLPVVLTLGAYQVGLLCQKKLRSPLANPILIAVGLVILFLLVSGMEPEVYQKGTASISWLMTPATICLAIPMYEQTLLLRKHFRAIAAGIASGALSCLALVLVCCVALGFERELAVSLLPKSITSAIGVPLGELYGGLGAITTTAIILTGIFASVLAVPLCKCFRLEDPVSRGVALGTSGHVIATAKAGELDSLTGAVSSLSLVVAGLLTSVVFPLVVSLL